VAAFIFRRILVSLTILIGASFLIYVMIALATDPLQEFRESRAPNRDELMAARVQALNLDVSIPLRYLGWLQGALGCAVPFADTCDLGLNFNGQSVAELLARAVPATLQLVTAATFLAWIVGISVGIISALRQNTGFDYSVTFAAFLFFSLPSFWVAVLAKEFIALPFNDFLRDPVVSPLAAIGLGAISGFIWSSLVGGDRRKRLSVFAIAGVGTALLLFYMAATNWFLNPGLGPVIVILSAAGIAALMTMLLSSLHDRKAVLTSGITAVIGVISYAALQPVLDEANFATLLLLGGIALAVGAAVGYFVGGYDRSLQMRLGALVALFISLVILVDRFMQSWNSYVTNPAIRGRPIPTIGSSTPTIRGDFWIQATDTFTHLLLPTAALVLVSIATYSRYSRAGMLDVMNQDYIRTARAKGLPERTVIVRHAFRNSLIPLATIVAADIGALLGGAVITEQVFAIPGMGQLFIAALIRGDPNPVMAFFLVVAIFVIVFNLIADLSYAALDPRVRAR